jgi:lipopolysaccharide transport system permease protein
MAADARATAAGAVQVIEPPRRWAVPDLAEVWHHRELVYFLARRDISVRYRQTAVGAAWAIAQPVGFAAVFSLVTSLVGRPPTEGIPFPVFALTGMTMWLFFSNGMALTAASTVGSAQLISKVYFPRLVIPLAAIVPPMIDFLIALAVLVIAMVAFGVSFGVNLLALPLVFALALVTVLGAGLWLSALSVRFRDVQHVVPFLTQIGLFLSPVFYSLSLIPDRFQALYSLNPLTAMLEGFRWAMLGTEDPTPVLLVSVTVSVLLMVTGLFYFARAERRFADDL